VIALINYGAGNIRSVEKALIQVGAQVKIFTRPDGLKDADAVVLPGVGAFDHCIQALQQQELLDPIRDYIRSGRPFLGICVGYQALFEKSEEFNSKADGLGIFAGKVVRFKEGLKVPQIGWNQLEVVSSENPLYQNIPNGSYVYFVHSYYPQPQDLSIIGSWTQYGEKFASSIWKNNVFATQFHPEKSQKIGLQILHNFVHGKG